MRGGGAENERDSPGKHSLKCTFRHLHENMNVSVCYTKILSKIFVWAGVEELFQDTQSHFIFRRILFGGLDSCQSITGC